MLIDLAHGTARERQAVAAPEPDPRASVAEKLDGASRPAQPELVAACAKPQETKMTRSILMAGTVMIGLASIASANAAGSKVTHRELNSTTPDAYQGTNDPAMGSGAMGDSVTTQTSTGQERVTIMGNPGVNARDLMGADVVDNGGRQVGKVRDVLRSGDMLDMAIIQLDRPFAGKNVAVTVGALQAGRGSNQYVLNFPASELGELPAYAQRNGAWEQRALH